MSSFNTQGISTFLSHTSRQIHGLKMNSPLTAATIGTGLLASFAVWCYKDYQDYLALGPGGPPYNVKGWAWITFAIRPFALGKSGATLVEDYSEHGAHESIQNLPVRRGERALLGGIAPHHQMSQRAPEVMRQVRLQTPSKEGRGHLVREVYLILLTI
jgi:hypothetical protein